MSNTRVTSVDIKRALAEKHWRDFFLTEVKSGPTQLSTPDGLKILDGLAIRKSWTSPCFTGYEVKVSRGDFLRDAKFYTYEELCNCLYVVCPKGMIDRTELPESVGLMYYDADKKAITTRKKAIFRKVEYSPELLLYIIYSRLDSDRYPFFSDKKSYFQAYLEEKLNNRHLADTVSSKLIQENARLETELERLYRVQRMSERYEAIDAVLKKHHIYGLKAGDLSTELDEALSRPCPPELTEVRVKLEKLVGEVRKMEKPIGHWVEHKYGTTLDPCCVQYYCSICNGVSKDFAPDECPCCGAKMEGIEKE